MAKTKTVYNNFAPTSAKLAPLAAAHRKAAKATSEALDSLKDATFDVLLSANKVTKDLKERFRVGYRWGQYAWWIAEEGETASKGDDL